MSVDLKKLREERLEIENQIYAELKKISQTINKFTEEGDAIEIIANHSYKLQVANGDILIIMDTGSIFFKDMRISTDFQLIKLVLERQDEIYNKFIEFNQRMVKIGKNISERYIKQ
ncbi:MAG: hypothetical protein HZC47_00175 [Methanobacterium sp.]|uniref:hypothetical protein n=1 Tax=Methanobacterium sp. TaxID=2164 RepID=UPI003D65A9F2|nr:hypothetical protein [Methanobacterium sp.]